jgi:poly(A) polymerase
MRAVRFRALLDAQFHPETYRALREQAVLIEIISGTRKLEELEKMLLGPHPDRALEDLWEIGILQYFLPELSSCKGVPQPKDFHREGDVWEHMLAIACAYREEHGIDVRLAALFHDCGKAETFSLEERIRFDGHPSVSAQRTEEALNRLQCPSRRAEKIVWLIRHHMMMDSFLTMGEGRKAHWYFHRWFSELLQLFELDILGTQPQDFNLYKKIVQDYHRYLDAHPRPPKPLLNGEEVMAILGLKPGRRVGEILKVLHEAQIREEIATKAEARAFVTKLTIDH